MAGDARARTRDHALVHGPRAGPRGRRGRRRLRPARADAARHRAGPAEAHRGERVVLLGPACRGQPQHRLPAARRRRTGSCSPPTRRACRPPPRSWKGCPAGMRPGPGSRSPASQGRPGTARPRRGRRHLADPRPARRPRNPADRGDPPHGRSPPARRTRGSPASRDGAGPAPPPGRRARIDRGADDFSGYWRVGATEEDLRAEAAD